MTMPKVTMASMLKSLERAGRDLESANQMMRTYRERAAAAEEEAARLRAVLTYLFDGRSDLPNWAAGTVEEALRHPSLST